MFVDKKNQLAYRGFEARLDDTTFEVVEWDSDEEPLDAMEEYKTLNDRIEDAPKPVDDASANHMLKGSKPKCLCSCAIKYGLANMCPGMLIFHMVW